jgi:adenylate cyclase
LEERLPRKLTVILHADVVDYSRLAGEDEDATHRQLKESLELIDNLVSSYNGRIVNTAGDAVLVMFPAVVDALSCATAVQHDLATRNQDVPDNRKVQFRIGVNLGDVIEDGGDIYGDGVNVAARLEGLAEPGGICISEQVYITVGNKLALDYQDIGAQAVKNIAEPLQAYRAQLKPGAEPPPPSERHKPVGISKARRRSVVAALAIMLVVAGGVLAWLKPWQPREESASVDRMVIPLPDKPSIAVLPFTNLSSDAEQEYFADGMTEDLIIDISKISSLDVIARHSTFSYKGQDTDVREVGRDLGASHVIEGSVRKVGDKIRITIQLINALDGKHVWAERYDRELKDVFIIQDEVIREIIIALSLRLTPEEEVRIVKHGTENLEAYDLFMRGRQQESFFSKESNVEAKRYYEQAIALDPNFAEAWAHLAQIHTLNGQFGWVDDIVAADKRALELVEQSIELGPNIPATRFAYSRILARNSIGQHNRAIAEAKKAIELDSNYADAHAFLGQLFILTGQAEKTTEPITTAMRINPNFPFWYYYTYGFAHFFMKDFDTAVEFIEKAIDRNPNVMFVRAAFVASLAMAGRQDDAEWEVEELYGQGFNKTLDEYVSENPIQDPAYRDLFREGLAKAGLL